ncbi:MAG TPA: beta-ketoacyl synthase N-terminal-like domain-containing protein [Gemmataceae bacterium]|nr:beta-ketoacyl synthase N-terminal-like domain-containing protein [Gemmataceae bacterium]
MLSPFLIVTPAHRLDGQLAIAAARAGETGILDLGYGEDQPARAAAIRSLVGRLRAGSRWGLRWDTLGDAGREPCCLKELLRDEKCPFLLLAGSGEQARAGAFALGEALEQARRLAGHVLLEVCRMDEALAAQEAGFDGVVVKGHEAGGWVGEESTFLLLQRLHGRLSIPYWVQGGIDPDTAAAVFLFGGTGVVYMIGQVAALRQEVIPMSDLHAEVAEGNLDILDKATRRLLPWQKSDSGQKPTPIEIAIVGMACMLPRAKDIRRYWQNICNRIDAIREVPADRWRVEDFYCEDRLARDRVYSKWGWFSR